MKFLDRFNLVKNTQIHYWTVLDKPHHIRNGSYYIVCKCVCKKEKEINFYSLLRGDSKSCGCKSEKDISAINAWREKNGPPNIKPYGVAAFNNIYNQYKTSARSKDLTFSLTKEEFKQITQLSCHYCGDPPNKTTNWSELNGNYTYNGIDRKDNHVGYEFDNCLPCCSTCNYLKRGHEYDFFVSHIHKISEKLKNEKNS